MLQQLVKKDANGRYENVNPRSWIEAIKDKNTGQTLVEILQGFNMYFLPYNGNTSATRCLVPTMLRKKGLWITYVKYDGNVYTEWYAADEIDDKSWGDSSNWRIGNNTLVGDITISANGNWVINGTETEFKAVGEKGNTPLIRVANNRLQVSYDLGDTYIDVTNNPVYTKFRWLGTTGDTQNNIVGRIQSSTDEGKTWTNMSNDFTNNLHISRYIGVNESLPTSGIAEGTIYAKGPYYDEGDTLNDNPIYRLWVYAWKGNTLAWQDNGEFQSIAAGVVQETGNSETQVMSQAAVTRELTELGRKTFPVVLKQDLSGYIKNDGTYISGAFSGIPFKATDYVPVKANDIIIYVGRKEGNSVSGLALYDGNKTFIKDVVSSTAKTEIKYKVEEDIAYIRCCSSYSTVEPMFVLHSYGNFEDVTNEEINKIKDYIGNIDYSVYKEVALIYSSSSNSPSSFFNYEYVKIPVNIGDVFTITASSDLSGRYIIITLNTDGKILTTEYDNVSLNGFEYTVQNNGYLIVNNNRINTVLSVKVVKRFDKNKTLAEISGKFVDKVFRVKVYNKDNFEQGYYSLRTEDSYPPKRYDSENSFSFSTNVKKGDIIVLKNTTGAGNIIPYALYDSTERVKYETATPNINKTYNYEEVVVSHNGIAAFNTPKSFIDDVEIIHYQQSLNVLEEKWVDSVYSDIFTKLNNENRPDDEVESYNKPIINSNIDIDGKSIKSINVYNQEDLDALDLNSLMIEDAIIVVNIFEGIYTYKDLMTLNGLNYPNTSLIVQGVGNVTMIGSDIQFSLQDSKAVIGNGFYSLPYDGDVSVNNQVFTDGKSVVEYADLSKTTSRKIYQSDNIVLIDKNELGLYLNEETINHIAENHNVFKIECAELKDYFITESYDTGASILCSKNWEGVYCSVYKLVDGIMIVSSPYDLLEDKTAYSSNPSFRLYNAFNETEEPLIQDGEAKIPLKYKELYLCREGKFISIENSSFDKFVVRGIHFLGSASNVIRIDNTAKFNAVSIVNNIFEGCKHHAVQTRVSNIEIKNNAFKNNFKNCILMNIEPTETDVYFENIIIENNSFENAGLDMSNFCCIKCNGNKYYISGNNLVDFGYMGIGVGLWYKNQNTSDVIGVVEKNTLEYTDTYAKYINRYAVYDGGAIYTWTKNTNTIIRFNTIFNYKNRGAGRGIFLDDGTKGVSVYGNIVGSNWNSYSIDLRTVNSSMNYVPDYNSRNFCGLNIVDARVRWEGKAEDNTTICASNIYVAHDNIVEKDTTYSISEEDSIITGDIERNRIVITQDIAAKIFALKFLHSFIKSRVFRYY